MSSTIYLLAKNGISPTNKHESRFNIWSRLKYENNESLVSMNDGATKLEHSKKQRISIPASGKNSNNTERIQSQTVMGRPHKC